MFAHSMQRGFALGAKHGIVEGYKAYMAGEAAPEMDETAMQGAIGIIIAVGGVLIALYIIAVVVGSISYSVSSGNIRLSSTWNTTITNIDSQAQSTFNLAKYIEVSRIKIRKWFLLVARIGACVAHSYHRGGYPYDRYRSFQRPRSIDSPSLETKAGLLLVSPQIRERTLNNAIAAG